MPRLRPLVREVGASEVVVLSTSNFFRRMQVPSPSSQDRKSAFQLREVRRLSDDSAEIRSSIVSPFHRC